MKPLPGKEGCTFMVWEERIQGGTLVNLNLNVLKKKRAWLPLTVFIMLVVFTSGGIFLWNYHDEPQFCATCHVMKPYLKSWESSDLLANVHAKAGLECLDCHKFDMQQSLGETIKYITGNYETPLRERSLPMEKCLQCHEHNSYTDLASRTEWLVEKIQRNPHKSHYGELECSNCHNMHRPSEDYCSQCHSPTNLLGPEWKSL
jgi:hypothetical protein